MRLQAVVYRLARRSSVKTKTIFLLAVCSVYLMAAHLPMSKSKKRAPQEVEAAVVTRLMGQKHEPVEGFQVLEASGETLSYYNMTALTTRQVERQRLVHRVCHGHEKELLGLSSEKWAYERIEINKDIPSTYCPLLKVGSTFWRRVFYAIHNKVRINTPFDISIAKALSGKSRTLKELLPLHQDETQNFLNSSINIMFIREPFTRLLSGYIDKLFSPNPYFWSAIGRFIIKKFRKNASDKSLRCGHDVTFPEFVQYVIDGEVHNRTERDGHFTPSYDQCKPCQINYNAIGKMETFGEDTAYILNQMGYNVSINSFKLWAVKAEEDAVIDSTVSPFSWKKQIKKCMSFHEAAKRIWHKLQIRGIVRKDRKMPYSQKEIEAVTSKKFIDAALGARGPKSERAFLKKQKVEGLRGSFKLVSNSDIEQIRSLFKPDFDLFGYDPYSEDIFRNQSDDTEQWLYDLSKL